MWVHLKREKKSVQRHQGGVVDFLRSVVFQYSSTNEGLQTMSSHGVVGQSGEAGGLTQRQGDQADPKTQADSHHHHNQVEPLKF